jgi:hypothetical protein
MRYELRVPASHFQLMFGDGLHAPGADTTDLWADSAPPRVVRGPGVFAFQVARFGGEVHVAIAVDEPAPEFPWFRLGDFELAVPSGEVVVFGPESTRADGEARVAVPVGIYSGAAFAVGEDAVGDELDPSGPERYLLGLWWIGRGS